MVMVLFSLVYVLVAVGRFCPPESGFLQTKQHTASTRARGPPPISGRRITRGARLNVNPKASIGNTNIRDESPGNALTAEVVRTFSRRLGCSSTVLKSPS